MPPKIPYKQVKINLKPKHFEKLEAFAEAKNISKAEWIRQKLKLEYEDMPQRKGKAKASETDPQLIYELRKIGNNLNQIATHANINKALDRQILSDLVRIEDKLKTLL